MAIRNGEPWLPDFCRAPMLFAAFLVAECVVLAAWLMPSPAAFDVAGFGLASLFALWLTLLACTALCLLGPHLNRLPAASGAPLALAMVVLLALAGALVVRWLDHQLDLGITGPAGTGRFVGSTGMLAAIFGALTLRYVLLQERWRQAVQAQARARFDALQARIQPHFLFNTLNTVSGLIQSAPAQAEEAVLDLADLLRAALAREGGRTRLREELDLARRYLAIEQLRLGDRLRVDWQVADDLPLDMGLPTLTLQPLVENAVLHGIARLPAGGTVSLQARREGTGVTVRVRNPLAAPVAASRPGRTQDNIRHRLRHALGAGARLSLDGSDGHYTVTLWLPVPGRRP
ncbi:MAG: histidine kinase [Pseudoxanthomonas sp.]|nr:histidine kinase [Pseudoxanthomonas sp.]